MFDQFPNFPNELKDYAQWAVSGASKAPMAMAADGKLALISVTAPGTWMTYAQALQALNTHRELVTTHVTNEGITITQTGLSIGYILNQADPFTCIDLDVKDVTTHPAKPDKWTTVADFDRYMSIINGLDSYTERSKSGKGIHIWVRASIGRGYRRDGVEIYSQERYIICTGDPFVSKPVADRQFILGNMISQMSPLVAVIELEELPEEADDWYIRQLAVSAANKDKFIDLWEGKWENYGFESQSEADLALMSMFTFYSPCNAQVRRLFRESKLGKREKAQKDDRYINATLKTIRDRQAREARVELSGILASADAIRELAREEIQAIQGGAPAVTGVAGPFGVLPERTLTPLHVAGAGEPVPVAAPANAALAQLAPVSPAMQQAGEDGLPWPPGMMGAIARFIYSTSWLPIKEVSIVSALGLMSGICGKAWHIPKSGLNLYIVLVARSAIGKEALHDGIATIINSCLPSCPFIGNFVDFKEHASGPALIKACAQSPSFVNVSGEWGRRMKRIAMEDDREGPMTTLRTQMTNLYQKSAPKSIVGGIGYSSQENNIESLTAVAYSLVGESTPQTFYDSLTDSMMEDGFLSRFLVVQYEGDRPEDNNGIIETPDEMLVSAISTIANHAYTAIGNNSSQLVGRTEEAAGILDAYGKMAAAKIRSYEDEGRRQMWNRATLKVLRVAALLAVADNFAVPIITAEHANWAIDLIMRDIALMSKRIEGGDIGLNDTSRERKIVSYIKTYISKPVSAGYKIPDEMRQAGIVPRQYLQVRCVRASAFYKHKAGANRALDETIGQMVSSGYLMEVKGDKLVEAYNYHGRAFRILKLPDYEAMANERD